MANPTGLLDDTRFLYEGQTEDVGCYVRAGRLLEKGESAWQSYEVWDTPAFGKLFRLDGYFMTSERDEFYYHENLIHVPAIVHPGLRRVLIIGGGDGGSAEELLKYSSVERIVLAELDEKVVELARRHFHSVHHGSLDDPRVEVRIGDGMAYVQEQGVAGGDRYDLIVLDLTDPVGPAEALYSETFFRECKALLSEGGALTLHIGSPVYQPDRVQDLLRRLRRVFALARPYFLYMPLYGSLWGLASASDSLDPLALSADEIDRRLAERAIGDLQHYNGSVHHAQFALPNNLRTLFA